MKYSKFPKLPAGPAFEDMSGFNRGATPESQPDSYKTGCLAMGISAKDNDGIKGAQKAVNSEPMQYK